MALTVVDGSLIRKDPEAIRVYTWDYDVLDNLAPAVTIVNSTWSILAIYPSTSDSALTKDSESVLPGSRSTQVRLTAGTMGQVYEITNRIVTNESPAQTKDKSIRVLIQPE